MIKNERQYRITKAQMEKFEAALALLQTAENAGLHRRLRQAERDALESQWKSLQAETAEYAFASLSRVSAVIQALNVEVREEVLPSVNAAPDLPQAFGKQAGRGR